MGAFRRFATRTWRSRTASRSTSWEAQSGFETSVCSWFAGRRSGFSCYDGDDDDGDDGDARGSGAGDYDDDDGVPIA